MKRIIFYFICIIVFLLNIGENVAFAVNEETTNINLSNETITVNDEKISENMEDSVYVTQNIETHEDINKKYENLKNKVITITKAGTYIISGKIDNGQIAVNVSDKEDVRLILNGVSITNKTAPAIIIYNAQDEEKEGEAGVIIELEHGTENKISGSHIPKNASYIINGELKKYDKKYDAAISSSVSIKFEGTGKLILNSDNEGIETKMHLTIENGRYEINSDDDSINASGDEKSVVTINNGQILANITSTANEGDGIDSNGYIYINGGEVYTFASEKSEDSGLDADLGIYINNGFVIGTGNISEKINDDSKQNFIQLEFANTIKKDEIITILDEKDNPIFAYEAIKNYKVIEISFQNLQNGKYSVYVGGKIKGIEFKGVYAEITEYQKGKIQQHGGMQPLNIENDNLQLKDEIPNGEIREKNSETSQRELPPNRKNEKIDRAPERGGSRNGIHNIEMSTDFILSKTSHKFSNIKNLEIKVEKENRKNIYISIIIIVLIIIIVMFITLKNRKNKNSKA